MKYNTCPVRSCPNCNIFCKWLTLRQTYQYCLAFQVDVSSMLQMNQTMIERRPLTLHLVNTNKQTQAINIGQAAHGVADYKAFYFGSWLWGSRNFHFTECRNKITHETAERTDHRARRLESSAFVSWKPTQQTHNIFITFFNGWIKSV